MGAILRDSAKPYSLWCGTCAQVGAERYRCTMFFLSRPWKQCSVRHDHEEGVIFQCHQCLGGKVNP